MIEQSGNISDTYAKRIENSFENLEIKQKRIRWPGGKKYESTITRIQPAQKKVNLPSCSDVVSHQIAQNLLFKGTRDLQPSASDQPVLSRAILRFQDGSILANAPNSRRRGCCSH